VQYKKYLLVTSIVSLYLIVFPISISARSGCCSHHGGVCGCGCCDGTSLSATCAPYYPECNSAPAYTPPAPVYVCTLNCNCASTTCIGKTCGDGCGGLCQGSLNCTPVTTSTKTESSVLGDSQATSTSNSSTNSEDDTTSWLVILGLIASPFILKKLKKK
jgi:hypothetical protein